MGTLTLLREGAQVPFLLAIYSYKQVERPRCLNACLKQCFNSVKALVGAFRKKMGQL